MEIVGVCKKTVSHVDPTFLHWDRLAPSYWNVNVTNSVILS